MGNIAHSAPNQPHLDDLVPAEGRVPHTPHPAGFQASTRAEHKFTSAKRSAEQKSILCVGPHQVCSPNTFAMIYYFLALAVFLLTIVAEGIQGLEPSLICSDDIYGRPAVADSATITEKLPFIKNDPDRQMDAFRIFAEPGSFHPRFSAFRNPYASRMVQLPMIWRFSKSQQSSQEPLDLHLR